MVGKGVDVKNSRIFQQCYVKCCKLQNLTPLNNVIPSGNGKVLDFCVDRIKYADWPPILNALSCDLSLHSVAIKCRQQVKTVLEHIDCERLAKTVNKRAVILTKFMLSNLVEALAQLLADTALLTALQLDGLPLRIPYLNPICEALLSNNSLQHLSLARCAVGDAGCLALCKAVRCLPNVLTLDLSGCELTALGAGYIADLLKHQKIHRYSENWVHTLRYRVPELDAMAGLRRVSLCGNGQLGDAGARRLLDVLADDLWIKALDLQSCGLTEECAAAALRALHSNTTLVVLDLRHNALVCADSVAAVRAALRRNERGLAGQYSWLSISASSSEGKSVKAVPCKNGMLKDRGVSNVRIASNKYATKTSTVKECAEELEEQLQEEISHRRQLEELNVQLVEQMRRLTRQRVQLWACSGSEQSLAASTRSGDVSSSSGSSSSVPIDQSTLAYIQRAFRDIYAFIKNNQCSGECLHDKSSRDAIGAVVEHPIDDIEEARSSEELEASSPRAPLAAKRALSTHRRVARAPRDVKKTTRSAHLLGDTQRARIGAQVDPNMIERQMGDTKSAHEGERDVADDVIAHAKKGGYEREGREGSCGSVSDSSATLVHSPRPPRAPQPPPPPNPRDALYSSTDDEEEEEEDYDRS